MKILIVTVYNSHNSGSFLQAYALYHVLLDMGHEVAFLKRNIKGSSHDKINVLNNIFRSLLKLRISQACYIFKEWCVYEKLQKRLPIKDMDSVFYNQCECIVIGSDTLWNFDSSYFRNNAANYLGSIFRGKRVITYAVSAGNTQMANFQKIISKYAGLSKIERVLVRDEHTKQLVELSTEYNATIVSDPTLIVAKSVFEIFCKTPVVSNPYILLYFSGRLPKDLIEEIKCIAKEYNLEIVSMPSKRSWCQKSLYSSPQNMVTYYSHAKYVITDTFHGTAFSMIYEKPFAVFDEGKNKVKELLLQYGEESRLFSCPKDVRMVLSQKSNVVKSGVMSSIRERSLKIIKQAIMK